MLSFTKYVITILLMVTLLPATSGIGIYHHICSNTGEHSTGLFHKAECKSHHHHKKQNSNHHNCCPSNDNQEHCKIEKNCCYEFSEYKSIEADLFKAHNSEISIKAYIVSIIKFKDLIDHKCEINAPIQNNYNENSINRIIKFILYQSNKDNSEDSFC